MSRALWLARPWFLASVAMLALNDHLLKGVAPGWLTGKLSDFAGLVVVATILAVVLGRTVGVVVAAVAFAALKLVPGVAELAAPILGGVTLRDASDLIALVVLPGLWVLLGRSQRRAASPRRAVQIVGLVAGLLATTATIDPIPPQTEDYLWNLRSDRSGSFYVVLDKAGDDASQYLVSADGGRSWQDAAAPTGPLSQASSAQPSEGTASPTDHSQVRVYEACVDDGVCYRTVERDLNTLPGVTKWETQVQRREPGGEWLTEVVFTEDDKDQFNTFAVSPVDDTQLVALVGQRRITHRTVGGDYLTVDVLPR